MIATSILLALVASAPVESRPPAQAVQQDQKPPPPPLPPRADAGAKLVDETGNEVVPGVLPASTSPAARAAWMQLCEASLAPGAQRQPVRAFSLDVDIRYKKSDASTNDLQARYRYLAPGFVRTLIKRSGREQMRGPEGDWSVDTNRVKTALVGRENAEDRRQLDETVSIAQNFVALTDPSALRILSLHTLERAPAHVPPKLAERAAALRWLELRSPDFHIGTAPARNAPAGPAAGSPAGPKVFRVQLGVDPVSGLAEQALVHEDAAQQALLPSSVLLALADYRPVDGFRVPRKILMYVVDESARPPAFRAQAGTDIVLDGIDLRPDLRPEHFLPD